MASEKFEIQAKFSVAFKQECLAATHENVLSPGIQLVCAIRIRLVLMQQVMCRHPSNGGKQWKQSDTVIPDTNPTVEHRGKPQKMCLPNGQPKGLQQVLEERGFNAQKLQVKCSPICPWENEDCCMARLLSKQDDFTNQPSMLEALIKDAGHECIFPPKFHCELNPIEMASIFYKFAFLLLLLNMHYVLGLVQVPLL